MRRVCKIKSRQARIAGSDEKFIEGRSLKRPRRVARTTRRGREKLSGREGKTVEQRANIKARIAIIIDFGLKFINFVILLIKITNIL